ncbi:hypothetical protein ACFSCX_10520 [Bacillus salitolerans]|uniref:Phosphatase n=1 Tax=Bacillus salitolerans TaxID=1437434 RepID=A0ABW4LPI7_9BACI
MKKFFLSLVVLFFVLGSGTLTAFAADPGVPIGKSVKEEESSVSDPGVPIG